MQVNFRYNRGSPDDVTSLRPMLSFLNQITVGPEVAPGRRWAETVIAVCEVKKQHGERTWGPIERIFMTVLWQKGKQKTVKLDSGVHCRKP